MSPRPADQAAVGRPAGRLQWLAWMGPSRSWAIRIIIIKLDPCVYRIRTWFGVRIRVRIRVIERERNGRVI